MMYALWHTLDIRFVRGACVSDPTFLPARHCESAASVGDATSCQGPSKLVALRGESRRGHLVPLTSLKAFAPQPSSRESV
eukprot:scaffold32403_cov73-Phaeocystis_antarctica.AAC.4